MPFDDALLSARHGMASEAREKVGLSSLLPNGMIVASGSGCEVHPRDGGG